jgi:hypothetical protein
LERSIWVSFNGGQSWKTLQADLPHTAVFDIRQQTQFNDLIIATHGRGTYIMDDIRPLQELDKARAAGQYFFQPRIAYNYVTTELAEGIYTEYAAPNPPSGAMFYFYQAKPGKKPPVIDIFDAGGHRVRHVIGMHKDPDSKKQIPFVKNEIGLNRFVWNFRSDPITPWLGAANEDARQPGFGLQVVPGTYSARFTFANGRTLSHSFVVKPDPDAPWTQSDYEKRHAFAVTALAKIDAVDRALNSIDAQIARLKKLGTPAALSEVQSGLAMEKMLTANYKNDEDGVMWGPGLIEDLQGVLFSVLGNDGPPLDPSYRAAAIMYPRYDKAMAQVSTWLASAKAIH